MGPFFGSLVVRDTTVAYARRFHGVRSSLLARRLYLLLCSFWRREMRRFHSDNLSVQRAQLLCGWLSIANVSDGVLGLTFEDPRRVIDALSDDAAHSA